MTEILVALQSSAVLFIVASGLTVIFGALRIVNLAHAGFYALGAYVAVMTSNLGLLDFWWGLVASFLVVGVVGGVVEVVIMRRVYRYEHAMQLVATFAVMLIIEFAITAIWGTFPMRMADIGGLGRRVEVLGHGTSLYQLFVIITALIIGIALYAFLEASRPGRVLRAVTSNPEMAGVLGVNVPRVLTGAFVLGSALAGLGGAIDGANKAILPTMGLVIIIKAFAVIVVGGMGSLPGAAIGALIIGFTEVGFGLTFPRYATLMVFAVMAAVLILKPSGILGRPETIRSA